LRRAGNFFSTTFAFASIDRMNRIKLATWLKMRRLSS